jgi:hypothetical protein
MLRRAARSAFADLETERAEGPALVRALGKLDAAWAEWKTRDDAQREAYDAWYREMYPENFK